MPDRALASTIAGQGKQSWRRRQQLRSVDLGGVKPRARYTTARQNPAIEQQRGGLTSPRYRHVPCIGKRAGCRIIKFGVDETKVRLTAGVILTAGDQDGSIGEQSRRVPGPRYIHVRGSGDCVRRGIVKFGVANDDANIVGYTTGQ